MPRKKKTDSQPEQPERIGVFVELSQDDLDKLKRLAERDHNCSLEFHAKKIITQHLANMLFYFTR